VRNSLNSIQMIAVGATSIYSTRDVRIQGKAEYRSFQHGEAGGGHSPMLKELLMSAPSTIASH
jgi:hypothetical protein